MPIVLASLTGPLVNLATHLIRSLGYAGVMFLVACSGVIGVPGTEPTMLFAGFNVYQGHLSLVGIIVFGVLGDVIGATIAYCIGYYGSRELVKRFHVRESGLDRAHGWFERRGVWVVFVSRLIPFVRAAFPYAAGVARMPYLRFIVLAALGSIVWITALGVLGREVGNQWETWRHHLEYADYVAVALVVLGLAYLIVRRQRGRNGGGRPDVVPADPETMDVVSR